MQKDANGNPHAMYLALEIVVRSIVKDQGSPKGAGGFARLLRDHPDGFPMFSIVSDPVPSAGPEHLRRCNTLQHFMCEKREAGHTLSALFGAFMNMYLYVGSQAIGAIKLADRIENWDPEHQAKLRQVGLRSSFELDDEEGRVFLPSRQTTTPFASWVGAMQLVICSLLASPLAPRTSSQPPSTRSNKWGSS